MKFITIHRKAIKDQRGMTLGEIEDFVNDLLAQDAPLLRDYVISVEENDHGKIQSLDVTFALNED